MYFDAIAKIVSERTGCDISTIKPESKFSELGIDSLDTVELLMKLEDELGIEIELDQTAFYPEGGGQPSDTGTLGAVEVTQVHEKDGFNLMGLNPFFVS